MSRSNGGVTHRSPLRIDVTSSSEDASHNNDEETSPYSLTDSAMGGSAMSPEPLDESHEINGSASAHDKSHCRYIINVWVKSTGMGIVKIDSKIHFLSPSLCT